MPEYPLALVARIMDARVHGPSEGRVVLGAATDSRRLRPGELFVAVRGERFDGHDFAPAALQVGAPAAVVARGRVPPGPGTYLEVEDPLLALGSFGAWHRNRFPQVRVVAVTGSVGKTTTKDLTAAAVGARLVTLKNPGNLNAEIGVPLTLLEITARHQVAVVEMAMRGPGQIRYLARLARPEVAVITHLGMSHVELLGSAEAIAEAKAELLDFLPAGGTAVLPADGEHAELLRSRVPPDCRCLRFGFSADAEMRGEYRGAAMGESGAGSRFLVEGAEGWIPLAGRHNVRNALAALAVGRALGVDLRTLLEGLASAEVSGMRMAVHRLPDGVLLLDDAYNASDPGAMRAALEVLGELAPGRRVAVLGDMLELGPASEEVHQKVGGYVAELRPDLLVAVGERAAGFVEGARAGGYPEGQIRRAADRGTALPLVRELLRPGDTVLVKASRGMAMEELVQGLLAGEGG